MSSFLLSATTIPPRYKKREILFCCVSCVYTGKGSGYRWIFHRYKADTHQQKSLFWRKTTIEIKWKKGNYFLDFLLCVWNIWMDSLCSQSVQLWLSSSFHETNQDGKKFKSVFGKVSKAWQQVYTCTWCTYTWLGFGSNQWNLILNKFKK